MRFHYNIKGMSCAACAVHVERAIRSVVKDGEVSVSLLTNSVTIDVAGELTGKEAEVLESRMSAAVRAAGYALLVDAPAAGDAAERKKIRARLILSAIFTLAVMYLSMGGMIGLPIPGFLAGEEHASAMAAAQMLLTLPVVVLNFGFFRRGFSALAHLAPNMDSLIAVGAGASLVYGGYAVCAIAFGWSADAGHWLHDLYFESAAMILTLVSLGKALEARAKNRASAAIRALSEMRPNHVTVLRDGKETPVSPEEVSVGELILIRAGEMVPADGIVVDGSGFADESALTGESMPVEKREGDRVRAACVLTDGVLTVRAERVGEDTSLSRLIRLLEDTAASKAPIARIADRVSGWFVPCVMGISALTLIVWLIATGDAERALRSAIAVLVISCPCALGLATPTAITVGIGRGAGNGILFRSAEALERLASVKTVVFDKTGTVTEGRPAVTAVIPLAGRDEEDVLCRAAAVERLSSHPLAVAVAREAEARGMELPDVSNFETTPGVGTAGSVGGVRAKVGKPDASLLASGDGQEWYRALTGLEADGKTAVLVTFDGVPAGVIGISDRVREDAAPVMEELRGEGIRTLIFTGDNEQTAAAVAKAISPDGYRAGLLPEEKEKMIRELRTDGVCAMVGDGINDAPALLGADVGIAVGAGTEVAIDCAGVVLSGSSLAGVPRAIALSRATLRIIRQNLFWALFYNALCIPVAAGVFYPLFGWQLSPMLASAAMSFSSVCVVTNALRLRKIHLKGDRKKMFGKKEEKTVQTVLRVEGMMCQHCVAHVRDALTAVRGVTSVEVSLEAGTATVTASESVSPDRLRAAVTAAGYQCEKMN